AVASSERVATQIARRHAVASPRTVWRGALRFADRVVGGWLGGMPRATEAAAMPSSMAAARISPAGLTVPRPWYELEAEAQDELLWPGSRETAAQPAPLVRQTISTAAERGQSIARTTLTAPATPSTPTTPTTATSIERPVGPVAEQVRRTGETAPEARSA